MSNTCNTGTVMNWYENKKPTTTAEIDRASTFMKTAVNEFGCYKNGNVIANDSRGMHGFGFNGNPSNLTCMCPYGMMYKDSNNKNSNAIIGNNCVDVKPTNCKNKWKLGQCLDNPPKNYVISNSKLKNVYLTWFWWPNLNEKDLLKYINFNMTLCNTIKQNNLPMNGLCFPFLISWPNSQNLSFFTTDTKYKWKDTTTSYDNKRDILGKWLVSNILESPILSYTATSQIKTKLIPGILLYISYKDGPWHTGFYQDVWNGTRTDLKNPINGNFFRSKKDFLPGTTPDAKWCWGAFFHFIINHVVTQCSNNLLPENFWIHLDKEGSHSTDTSFSEYDYTYNTSKLIGSSIKNNNNKPIIFLASALTTPCDPTVKTKNTTDACAYTTQPPAVVPEYYWGVGNQMPCDGSLGSYGYARTACTSLSSHRRLSGYPKAYTDLIEGNGEFKGSDCITGTQKENGWLGSNGWSAAIKNLGKTNNTIWPSFSLENLSLCDLNDPNCYSQWETQKLKGNTPLSNGSIKYKNFTKNTTICNSMLFGSLLPNGENQELKQGMKSCGVFDGFSYWRFKDFVNFLHYFSNKYNSPNLVVYEASFIPYHWFVDLGLQPTLLSLLNNKYTSSLIPNPSNSGTTCQYYKDSTGSCKQIKPNTNPPGNKYCDPSCTKICTTASQCNNLTCGSGEPFGPGPNLPPSGGGGNSGISNNNASSFNKLPIPIIVALILISILILSGFIAYLYKRRNR